MSDKRVYFLPQSSLPKGQKAIPCINQNKIENRKHNIVLPKTVLLTQVSGPTACAAQRKAANMVCMDFLE